MFVQSSLSLSLILVLLIQSTCGFGFECKHKVGNIVNKLNLDKIITINNQEKKNSLRSLALLTLSFGLPLSPLMVSVSPSAAVSGGGKGKKTVTTLTVLL